jgi:hypothetical protein
MTWVRSFRLRSEGNQSISRASLAGSGPGATFKSLIDFNIASLACTGILGENFYDPTTIISEMLLYRSEGTPYERGVQQGTACKNLARPWFNQRMAQDPHDLTLTAGWRARLETNAPTLMEEGRGIAVGLGMDFESYLSVLCRFQELPVNCTSFGLRSGQDAVPLIGKTDDLYASEVGHNVMGTVIPKGGYRHIDFHFAGTTWTIAGMNEHGLAIAMTGIPGPLLDGPGIPSLWALHEILPACATVEEVVARVKELSVVHYGFSLQIGDAAGNLTLLEKTGLGTKMISVQGEKPLVHTNHILDAAFSAQNPRQPAALRTNSAERFDHAVTLAAEMKRTEEGLIAVLGNRTEHGSICQQGEGGLYTDFSVIFMPVSKSLVFWQGTPRADNLNRLQLDESYFSKT